MLTLIAAVDGQGGIGRKNSIPWYNKADMAHFKRTTMGHNILMGRSTYESIGRALPGRNNFVLSKTLEIAPEGTTLVRSIEEFKALKLEEVFVIGGASIYELFMPEADRLILTYIMGVYSCDTFFPKVKLEDWDIEEVHLLGEYASALTYNRRVK